MTTAILVRTFVHCPRELPTRKPFPMEVSLIEVAGKLATNTNGCEECCASEPCPSCFSFVRKHVEHVFLNNPETLTPSKPLEVYPPRQA